MLIINYTTSYNALDQFVEDHNRKQEELTEKIKASVLFTAKEIIRVYGAFLAKANNMVRLKPGKLPALKTNNSQLATLVKVSSRTIQRHIKKLQMAGIIVDKFIWGRNAGYELLINPKILLARCGEDKNVPKNSQETAQEKPSENQYVKEGGTTKCPQSYTGNNRYIKNNLLMGVDNDTVDVADQVENIQQTGNTLTGNTREKVAEKIAPGEAQDDGAREKVRQRASRENWEQGSGARGTSHSSYADRLWQLAKTLLYKDVFLTEYQEKQAQKMLLDWYNPVPEQHLDEVHRQYSERLVLVRQFIDRDPENRFVQLPYKYFDTENPNGFTGTKKWHKKHTLRKNEVRKKLVLHNQVKKFHKNENRTDAKRRPALEVYRECEKKVKSLQDNRFLELFYKTVLEPGMINTIK